MVTKASTRPPPAAAKGEAREEREARLAKALRENLKRRKAQARVRKDTSAKSVDN